MSSHPLLFFFFFFNDTATPEISPLPLHDALPIPPSRRDTRPAHTSREPRSRRIEQMQLSAVELHTHPIAKSQVRDAVHSRHERWAARVHSDERIRTERLDAAHLGPSDALVGGNEAHGLGAHAEGDLGIVALQRHGDRPGAAVHYPPPLPPPPRPAPHAVP